MSKENRSAEDLMRLGRTAIPTECFVVFAKTAVNLVQQEFLGAVLAIVMGLQGVRERRMAAVVHQSRDLKRTTICVKRVRSDLLHYFENLRVGVPPDMAKRP